MEVNGIDLEKYKEHPRVLEIRFINLFDMIEREYGYQTAIKYCESIAATFNCNMTFIQGLINNRYTIKRASKTHFRRWRQEVIFSSACYGDSLYKIAKYYFGVTTSTIYNQKEFYDINTFLNEAWLRELDENVNLCGTKAYRVEVKRFIEVIEDLSNILMKWRGRK